MKEGTDIRFAFLCDHSGGMWRVACEMARTDTRKSLRKLLLLPGHKGAGSRVERGQSG